MRNQKINSLLCIALLLINFPISYVSALDEVSPIIKNYTLAGQDWGFYEINDLDVDLIIDYQWNSDRTVQGLEVLKPIFDTMLAFEDNFERSTYYETLGYFEGTFDNGRTSADSNGTLYYIFYNPNTLAADIQLTLTYRIGILDPWAIGLLSAVGAIIFLSIGIFIVIKIRQKMIKDAIEEEELTPMQKYFQ
ncbi:MAG: hypothetical protein FK734_16535 [Asgard group archaeon]|nr:hypothetical protein [Asgard group archaeon]